MNDYYITVPEDKREEFISSLSDYRFTVTDVNEDNIQISAHPAFVEVLRENYTYDFSECFNGAARDLWVHYTKKEGLWTESLECESHWNGGPWETITADYFNEAIDNIHDEDWVYSS